MSSRDFYDLCYDLYKREMDDADVIYQRSSSTLFALPILFASFYALGRTDLLPKCFSRVDIFFYYLASVTAMLPLAVSVVMLFLAVCPCKKYKSLASMGVWQDWRTQYQEYLTNRQGNDQSQDPSALDAAMIENICPRLAEAQTNNAPINEKRRGYLRSSVLWAAVGMIGIGLQAILYFILKIQGI